MIRRYVRGPGEDEPIVIYEGPGTDAKSWLYADHQGSVTASADASGNPISAMSYGPFGEPSTTTGIELRYTGQMLDPDTGLYYYKARWYSPWMGRFLSPDPIGIDDGMHLYTYVGNDPVNYVDPSGNLKELACSAIGLLGDSGRLRIGADFAGGYFGFARGGAGISLRGDGSLEVDGYLGAGIGAGLLVGAGVGLDNAGGKATGINANASHEVTGGVGVGSYGGGVSFPSSGSVVDPSVDFNSTQVSGGVSVGPKVGFGVGSTKSGNISARSPGICR